MKYDFSRLTPAQQELLTYQGWRVGCGIPAVQPRPATVRKLIERGLVIEHETQYGPLTFKEYEVPLNVHIAWCAHCAKE